MKLFLISIDIKIHHISLDNLALANSSNTTEHVLYFSS